LAGQRQLKKLVGDGLDRRGQPDASKLPQNALPSQGQEQPRGASVEFERSRRGSDTSDWCYASLEDVRQNLASTGYGMERIAFVKGKVEDTLPGSAPDSISLLRLDTDWYESTLHELVHLFPRLSAGGVLIIDDYGHWRGARRAVDEYLRDNSIRMLFDRVDYSGRIAVKQ
jgi:hypothetical protein